MYRHLCNISLFFMGRALLKCCKISMSAFFRTGMQPFIANLNIFFDSTQILLKKSSSVFRLINHNSFWRTSKYFITLHYIYYNMKNVICLLAGVLTGASSMLGATFTRTAKGLVADLDTMRVELQFYTPEALRVIKTPVGQPLPEASLSVTAKPAETPFQVIEKGSKLILKSKSLTATLDKTTGKISYTSPKGKKLLQEKATTWTPVDDAGSPSYRVGQSFALDKNEAIYGLGNYQTDRLSQRGHSHRLMPGNLEDGIGVLNSVKGYGIIWDNYSPTAFNDNANGASFESEVGRGVDYYFLAGGNVDGNVRVIRELTGSAPMFPLWTYGFWQSRERYRSQAEIVDVVRQYRKAGIPLDGIIQDWQYWGNNYLWNAMEFMNEEYPNPKQMVDDIHGENAHVILSIWSSFGPKTKPYKQLDEKGLLFNFATWPESGISHVWPPRMDYPSGVRVYDAYSAEARDIYWQNLKRLHSLGIDGWWMDSTEPDHYHESKADFDTPTAMGSFRKVRNAYPLMTVGGVHDHQRAVDSTKRIFILTRSGYTGQQRYANNIWTGDVGSNWKNLRRQIPALLNHSMTGHPHVNSDIGGFFAGAYNFDGPNSAHRNPLFGELYVRWMQMGLFNPMMRSHGADIKREVYLFDGPVRQALTDAIRMRYRLLPYIYSTGWQVTKNNSSIMRPLATDFASDERTHEIADQYLFGANIMTAPIVKANYTTEAITAPSDTVINWDRPVAHNVYLPKGTAWWDFDSEKSYTGGREITMQSTLATIPLYLRAGTILPLGHDVQWAEQTPWVELEVRVYPGANGSFTLYEDEGDNYNYERGAYSEIDFRWNDATRTLIIAPRRGSYPGMPQQRKFNIRLAGTTTQAPVEYDGTEKTIKL